MTIAPDATADAAPQSAISSQANPATAFFFPRQWHHRAISAPAAWAAGKLGASTVRVAILDTGIDYTYPDLNGLVDLASSKSFVPSDDALVAANFPGKNSCTDLHFHGTHVASTVSSKALVVAGVTSRTTLICVKVLGANGSGDDAGVLQGILWAADHGADVINMSLGSEFPRAGSGRQGAAINRAINYAFSKGTLIVVSAGNGAEDLDHNGNTFESFCNAANVVCVAATGPTAQASVNGPRTNIDAPAFYTNYGRSSINVAAPGGNNASAVWEACSQTTLLAGLAVCRTGIFTVGAQGTSMAAPHTTGLAALLVADLGSGNPARIRAALQKSADDLGQPGTDPFYGKGRINVKTALGL